MASKDLCERQARERTMLEHLLDHMVMPVIVEKQKENPMNYQKMAVAFDNNRPTETEYQRKHLLQSLADARDEKIEELSKHFGLTDDEAPMSFKDFMARVKAGDIMYDGCRNEDHAHGDIWHHLRWRNPKKKEDLDGFKAAKNLLKAAYARAKDEIIVLDLEKALEAKRTFESASFLS